MPTWIHPFHDEAGTEYSYFSIDDITSEIKITESTYNQALELVKNGQAKLTKSEIHPASGKKDALSPQIGNFAIHISPHINVMVAFSKSTLISCRCNNSECYRNYSPYQNGICVHEAAAFLLIQKFLKENRPGDCTDENAFSLLKTFRRNRQIQKNSESASVHLEPRISFEGKSLSARLYISVPGVKRSYVVRNILDLISAVDNKQTYALGKSAEIDFSKQDFDKPSQELVQAYNSWQTEQKELNRGYYYTDDLRFYIKFCGERLDRLFDLYENKELEFEGVKDEKMHLQTADPRLKFKIKKLAGHTAKQFEGIVVSGRLPLLLSGGKYSYCLEPETNTLCRLSPEFEKHLSIFYEMKVSQNGAFSFQIGRKSLAEFYYTVLPELKKIADINETNTTEIEQYLPPEVAFKFYLDVDNGRPECRVGTWYGDTGVAIFDLLTISIPKEDFRDAHREQMVLDFVMQYFPEFRRTEERFLAPDDADAVYDILENAVPRLIEMGEVVCTDRFRNIQVHRKCKFSLGVSIDNDLLSLDIITEDLTPAELLDILKSYKQNKKYHRLKTGEFVDIDESVQELFNMYEAMHISPKEFVKGKIQLPSYRAFYLDKMLEQSQEIYAKRDSHYKQLIRDMKTVTESDFEIPESLGQTLRGYQQFGHKWLRTLAGFGFGGILADDMGLGKTLQMISVLLAEKQDGDTGTSLIVCPASLVFNWAAEFDKFAPGMKYCTVVGTQKERAELIQQYRDYDVLITSYDLIKRDITNYEECAFSYQILDEAQYIKNHTTAAAKSVKLVRAKHKFALTGTPIENRLSELWSIFDYLMPGFLYKYEEFKRDFETPIVKHSDETATKRLRRMTSLFILRRLKKDVLRDLPDKLEENYVVRLDEEQRHIYDAKVLELRHLLENSSPESFQNIKLQIFSYLTQIRQICCDPKLLFGDYAGESAKRAACMEIIQRAMEGEHRILLFSQFTSMLELLEQDLNAAGIPYYKITGETSKKKRMELVDSFNSDDTPVFLISLKAGGTGLNLTGADVVVHYDPWWNVAAQNQATDRAHRIGQTRAVTVYKLIAKNTIEEKIQQMQEKKQNLAESVLSGEFVNLSSLSKDDLLQILG